MELTPRRHQVSAVAPFLLLMPVFSMAGAVFFLGEAPTANVLLGGLIVLVGGDHIAERPGRWRLDAPEIN